jgi:hypothetical protein
LGVDPLDLSNQFIKPEDAKTAVKVVGRRQHELPGRNAAHPLIF